MTCFGNRIKFDQQIEEITQNNRTMGIEEFLLDRAEKKGIERGKENGRIEFVKSLLRETSFDTDKIASLVGVSAEFVERIKNE